MAPRVVALAEARHTSAPAEVAGAAQAPDRVARLSRSDRNLAQISATVRSELPG